MKNTLLPLSLLFMLSQAQADIRNELENIYIRSANTLLFFTSENIISSGSYEFGSKDETLDTTLFPLKYVFKNDSDFYNFYINGSIGYSKYEEKNIDFRGSFDEIDIKTTALKLGVGVRFNILKDTDLMFGGAYIYSKVKGIYKSPEPLDPSDPIDRALDYVFNSDNNFNTFEVISSIGYHPTINNYKPYARADIRYFDTEIDDPFATISNTTSTISKLKIGVITPPVTSIKGLPLKLEFYASDVLVNGDMKDALEMGNFFLLGTTFHICTTSALKYVSDVSFDINIVRGDHLDGLNFGFGLSF